MAVIQLHEMQMNIHIFADPTHIGGYSGKLEMGGILESTGSVFLVLRHAALLVIISM